MAALLGDLPSGADECKHLKRPKADFVIRLKRLAYDLMQGKDAT
jgi:hypothetical protein